ncbi:hypothetical protein NUSPORA_01499 [Nucleospora cyclopteri]
MLSTSKITESCFKNYFDSAINGDLINIDVFKKICYMGIPDNLRPTAYKVLLNSYNCKISDFKFIEERKLKEYKTFLCDFKPNKLKNDQLTAASGNYCRFYISEPIYHQIYIDVLRIPVKYRNIGEIDYSYIYMNVLCLVAYKRPYLGYVQGMSDLLVPFMLIHIKNNVEKPDLLKIESQIYFCFSSLLNKIQHNIYTMQSNLIHKLDGKLKKYDRAFYRFLKEKEIDLHIIVFRWFNCLFIREFKMKHWLRLFDSMLSSELDEFLVYFSLSLLLSCKSVIIRRDFSEIVIYMQNLIEKDINVYDLLGKVVFMKQEEKKMT